VALALQDNGLRQRIRNDLRNAPFREHKLEFSRYIRGNSGGILLAKMAQATGRSREELLALIESIRPLEFYMPVDEHRASWTGGEDLLVASILEDDPREPPAAFDLEGRPVALDHYQPPATPTLSIVPLETDFTRPLDPNLWENTRDQGGRAIGIYQRRAGGPDQGAAGFQVSLMEIEEPCDDPTEIDCGGGGGGGGSGGGGTVDPWSTRPTGLYVTYLYIPDDHEGFLKGDPEFEIHLQAPVGDPTKTEDIRCAGEHAPHPLSRFDMNGKSTTQVFMIADSLEQARFRASYGNNFGMGIVAWEDDDTACTIKVEQDRFKNAMLAAAAAAPLAYAAIQAPTTQNILKALPGVLTAAFAAANWLKSNDELVGIAHMPTPTCNGRAAWTLGSNKGCMVLKAHDRSAYAN